MNFFANIDQKIRIWNHKRIDAFRSLRLAVFKIFLNQKPHGQMKSNPISIDILRLDGKIGDSIVSTGFIKTLQKNFPDSVIRIFANTQNAFIYQKIPAIQVYTVQKGFLRTLLFFIFLKQKRTDVLINTTHILSPSSLFLSRFITAPCKIVFKNHDFKMYSHHIDYNLMTEHMTDRYLQILNLMGHKSSEQLDYIYQPNTASRAQAEQIVTTLKQDLKIKKVVILNSFAGARLRNLNQKRTVAIAHKLADEGYGVMSIGNSGDLNIIREWQKAFPHSNWIAGPGGSFDVNAALIAQSDVVITPDTSIVHLTCALKTSLVAIYREDEGDEKNSVIWAPLGTEFKIVTAPKIEDAELDINSASVEEILLKTRQLLTASPA